MSTQNNDFLKRLRATFKPEAQEHIDAMSSGLIEIEKASSPPARKKITEKIHREAHSLKGAARAVNEAEMETICQALESVFAALKNEDISVSTELLDLLHQALDSLQTLLGSVGAESRPLDQGTISKLATNIGNASKGIVRPAPRTAEAEPELEGVTPPGEEAVSFPAAGQVMLGDTVRVATTRLDSLLLQAEEMLSAGLAAGQRRAELQDVRASLSDWQRAWFSERTRLRQQLARNAQETHPGRGSEATEAALNLLDQNYDRTRFLETRLAELSNLMSQDERSLGRMVDVLLEDARSVLLCPFSTLLQGFPRLVRDLSADTGKDIELVIEGQEIEIDRRVLEQMKDPLIHAMRNCIDHGIEKPDERKRRKKPPKGTVTVAISHISARNVQILVSDDGSGIDVARTRSAAVKAGILSQEEAEALSDEDALSLVYYPGVSTSRIITEISGQGLGLAIVRENVEGLGGTVSLQNRPGSGMTLEIVVPITLATFRGVVVRFGENLFVIPTASVEQVLRVKTEDVKTVENREAIEIDNRAVSLVRLGDALEVAQPPNTDEARDVAQAVVLCSNGTRVAFLVDEVIEECEVLVKPLGTQLSRVRNVSGATILGTGKVVPILNVSDLLKSASLPSVGAAVRPPVAAPGEEPRKQTALLVEDSITARTLLKNILEGAGYTVVTAVDGMDAFTQLREAECDFVVSDVDMPRMDGFELTKRIRSDRKLADLPVVLVTALESREERERGVDVGANAYIIKRSFDQSNLLEVIRRLT